MLNQKEKYKYSLAISRNIGIINLKVQRQISKLSVAIAGCGAEGGTLALNLAKLGFKKFFLADPKKYDLVDLNRQVCDYNDIGKNKALVIKRKILSINPQAKVGIFKKGLNQDNAKLFLKEADIVIDALDYEVPELSILLHNECQKRKLFIFSGVSVGFGCNIFVFSPYSKYTMDDFIKSSPFCWVPELPKYLSRKVFSDVINGEKPAPVIISGVLLMTGLMIETIIRYINGEKIPVMPQYISLDLKTRVFKISYINKNK